MSGMGEGWRGAHGSNHWKGMLDPLDIHLRHSILLYGDLVQATYDAFNNDPHSKYCGSSRYGKKDFFRKVGLAPPGDPKWDYQVTRFLYATAAVDSFPAAFLAKSHSREAWSKESNWIGYVAVATDQGKQKLGRRDIVVAWRGTIRDLEWIDVFKPKLQSVAHLLNRSKSETPPAKSETPAESQHWYDKVLHLGGDDSSDDDETEPKVMSGWHIIYTSRDAKSPYVKNSAREQVLEEIKRLLQLYKSEDVSITTAGHSLGAALAVISALDVVENALPVVKPDVPVTAFVVGSPGVGNAEFKRRFEAHPQLRSLHVVNVIDLIPLYPSRFLKFANIGTRLQIDTRKSPYLKDSKNPSDWHNLQAQLLVVAGWQGMDLPFRLAVERNPALVNKSCDFLKEECLIPASWWVEKNKGMVLHGLGNWVLADPDHDDVPAPEDSPPPPL